MSSDPLIKARALHGEPTERSFRMSTAQLGVIVAFVSIGVVFAATLIAYLVTRAQAEVWRTQASPPLPIGLLGSTALLIGVSGSMHSAVSSIRHNRHQALERSLWLALVFAVGFLIGQAFNWSYMMRAHVATAPQSLYAFTFYVLTGVHALHVLAGFVPLGTVLGRASRREYSSSRFEGVSLCAQYWHYLGVIWLILLATLFFTT